MSFPLSEDDVRAIVQNELRRDHSRSGKREDALIWAMRLHENRGSVTPETIITTAKAFEEYVYGGDSQ